MAIAAAISLAIGTSGCAEVVAYYAAVEVANHMQAALDGQAPPSFYKIDSSQVVWGDDDWERHWRAQGTSIEPIPEWKSIDMKGVPPPPEVKREIES